MDDWKPITKDTPHGEHILYFPPLISRGEYHGMMRVDMYPVAYPRQPTHYIPKPSPPK